MGSESIHYHNSINKVKIVPYETKYLPSFIELNTIWIQQYFKVEHNDILQLQQAESTIISTGGTILFLVDTITDDVYGCVAMVYDSENSQWELAKMCVRADQQGKHYGDVLMEAGRLMQ